MREARARMRKVCRRQVARELRLQIEDESPRIANRVWHRERTRQHRLVARLQEFHIGRRQLEPRIACQQVRERVEHRGVELVLEQRPELSHDLRLRRADSVHLEHHPAIGRAATSLLLLLLRCDSGAAFDCRQRARRYRTHTLKGRRRCRGLVVLARAIGGGVTRSSGRVARIILAGVAGGHQRCQMRETQVDHVLGGDLLIHEHIVPIQHLERM